MQIIDFNTKPTLYQCESNWNWDIPVFHDYDIWIALHGRGTLRVNQKRYELTAGSAFLLKPGDGVYGSHDSSSPIRAFAFHFAGTFSPLPPADQFPDHRRFQDLALLESLTERATSPLSPTPERLRTAELACATLLSIFYELKEMDSGDQERLEQCAQSIRREPGQQTRIPEMARRCGMSEGHFSRRFKEMYGSSPTRFRLEARISRARQLLGQSRLTLAEISEATGFHDEMHFSRIFHREVGQPPGAFRKQQPHVNQAADVSAIPPPDL